MNAPMEGGLKRERARRRREGGPQGRDGPKEEGALWEAGPQARQRPIVGNPSDERDPKKGEPEGRMAHKEGGPK